MAWLILLFHIILSITEAIAGQKIAKHGCQEKCGAFDIPYPFGIGPGCAHSRGFELTCNLTGSRMVPFRINSQVLSINIATAQARVHLPISWQCIQDIPGKNKKNSNLFVNMSNVYRLSNLDNRFTVVGCQSLAYSKMWNWDSGKQYSYRTGCVSTCYNNESLTDGPCSGNGCCQISIPSGISSYIISFDKIFNSSQFQGHKRCSYAAVLATDSFKFRTSFVTTFDFMTEHNGMVPVVLDWSIRENTCEVAQTNTSNYACVSNHSVCFNSTNGPGYFCNCSNGYQGNPYLLDGCQDINECDDKSTCFESGTCINTEGSYKCVCPQGMQGDATKKGGCFLKFDGQGLSRGVKLAIGIAVGLMLLLVFSFSTYIVHERRKLASMREKYFEQYGGRLLLEEMKFNHGTAFSIFKEDELKEATNFFDETRMLGQGGNGTVYKGTLKSSECVAIKKCKIIDERNKKEFGKEMLILSQINHKNVVKILGCCLEVEIPILVYKFISNGTLFDLLQSASRISMSIRLKIAQEAAEALAYLHSWASPPIVHCDVKSANILLDENYVAKVSDFGASALAPSDEDQFLTLVQGIRGYLDPQSMQTGQLTVKSDVYSYGVVLLELLTRKKPFYLVGPEERSLSFSFLTAMKDNNLNDIMDKQILDEENMNLIKAVAKLATECLNMEGEKRPEMREVAERLDKLRKAMKQPLELDNNHDIY